MTPAATCSPVRRCPRRKSDTPFRVFERAFQDFGLPDASRTDNRVPFASAHALYGLSKLAVWWRRLGIRLERIAPGHVETNERATIRAAVLFRSVCRWWF